MNQLRLHLIYPLLGLYFFSCASKPTVELPEKEYLKDRVSVKTVLMQTHAAYIRGCLEAHKESNSKDKGFKYCKKKADSYLESDVISILEQ